MMTKITKFWCPRKILILCLILFTQNVASFWEYAISTNKQIFLYDSNWTRIDATIVKDGLTSINTITYDAVHEVFYFADGKYPKIFALKFNDARSFVFSEFAEIKDTKIKDLVYDFHDDALYWSTAGSGKISKLSVTNRGKNVKLTEEVFLQVNSSVSGLELDTCNRNLYFTTISSEAPMINVVPLKEPKKVKSFGNGNHVTPVAISLDHQNRRLYVADRHDTSYSIDSYDSKGNDFRTETKSHEKSPRSVTVDDNFVYFIEADWNHLSRFRKDGNERKTTEEMFTLNYDPTDIIVRRNFVVDHEENCKLSPSRMKEVKEEKKKQVNPTTIQQFSKTCLHGGNLDTQSSSCICKESFDGEFCEINLCYHFCLNDGECAMEKDFQLQKLEPHCSCKKGFNGKRCEIDVCNNFCLNNGKCLISNSREPTCECGDDFSGARCETLKTHEIEVVTTVPTTSSPETISSTLVSINFPYEKSIEENQTPISCHEDKSKDRRTLIYVIIMGIIAMALIVVIVIVSLLLWKGKSIPTPRPHKKYVFHKKIDNSTYRPTTEQCEVIIEDCCNMNICETPCYDPKILQQEINESNFSVKLKSSKKCNGSTKDDKQDLLKNMELNQ